MRERRRRRRRRATTMRHAGCFFCDAARGLSRYIRAHLRTTACYRWSMWPLRAAGRGIQGRRRRARDGKGVREWFLSSLVDGATSTTKKLFLLLAHVSVSGRVGSSNAARGDSREDSSCLSGSGAAHKGLEHGEHFVFLSECGFFSSFFRANSWSVRARPRPLLLFFSSSLVLFSLPLLLFTHKNQTPPLSIFSRT